MGKILRYAGIGPRKTPTDQLDVMVSIARQLSKSGWWLSSGWGKGADQAFGMGHDLSTQVQWLPWQGYRGQRDDIRPFQLMRPSAYMMGVAEQHHPYWPNMKRTTKLLMTRNAAILLGDEKDQFVDMVVYWQSEADENSLTSGTNHTRRIANAWGIPSFNIRLSTDQIELCAFVEAKERYS